jgi:flagellar hook-associated protein 3 FlgL
MTIGSVGFRSSSMVDSLVAMRAQLADLQRQLATGKKANDYAALGIDRGLTVGLRAHLSAIAGYTSTITNVGVRINLAQTALARISDIGREVKNAVSPNNSDLLQAQRTAQNALSEMLGLLNTQAGDRYIFAGMATDRPAVETVGHILDGDGARAGLRQFISERKQADLGDGLGRLVVSQPSATSVQVAEDVAGSPFGFKLAAINSQLSGSTVTGPAGSPPAMSVDLGATNPNPGETVSFSFTLPDGSHETLTLAATTSNPPGANEFTIGADSTETAANLQSALTGAIGSLARTSLAAASAVAASGEFFNADANNPPMRVAGPPYDTATALVQGTAADTVIWYTGESSATPARQTANARVDQTISVSYGVRANEDAIRLQLQTIAAMAAIDLPTGDPDAQARNAALAARARPALDGPPGTQHIEDIESELASAQATLSAASERHQQTTATLSDFLQQIEGAKPEEVAAQILSLQTSLQASMQTTALLYKTSLVNYL